MGSLELVPILVGGLVGGIPALITAIYLYGRLSERVKTTAERVDQSEKRIQQHLENPSVHRSEDTRVRDAESRAEVQARLTSIEHKIDLMMTGYKKEN